VHGCKKRDDEHRYMTRAHRLPDVTKKIEDMGTRARAVFLDIDIDGSRDAFKRATEFVATSSIKYGLSTDDVTKLGGSYRAPSASRRGTKLSTRAPYELQTAALAHGPHCNGDCLPVAPAPVLGQRDD
jgi:hypothetical protein